MELYRTPALESALAYLPRSDLMLCPVSSFCLCLCMLVGRDQAADFELIVQPPPSQAGQLWQLFKFHTSVSFSATSV